MPSNQAISKITARVYSNMLFLLYPGNPGSHVEGIIAPCKIDARANLISWTYLGGGNTVSQNHEPMRRAGRK
jgi:hypothetical protein